MNGQLLNRERNEQNENKPSRQNETARKHSLGWATDEKLQLPPLFSLSSHSAQSTPTKSKVLGSEFLRSGVAPEVNFEYLNV
jgi:hypothetical protein